MNIEAIYEDSHEDFIIIVLLFLTCTGINIEVELQWKGNARRMQKGHWGVW